MQEAKFRLGTVVVTPGALRALEESEELPLPFLVIHQQGSWGDLDAEDQKTNDAAVAHEGTPARQQRVLSSYRTKAGVKFWIITERDRSVTTLLLPDEY